MFEVLILSFFNLFYFPVVLEHIALSFVRYRRNYVFPLCEDSQQECYSIVEGLRRNLAFAISDSLIPFRCRPNVLRCFGNSPLFRVERINPHFSHIR
jgi:hypothetical protein